VWLALEGANARKESESALDRTAELVRTTGARAYEPQILVERARLAGDVSDTAGRQQ